MRVTGDAPPAGFTGGRVSGIYTVTRDIFFSPPDTVCIMFSSLWVLSSVITKGTVLVCEPARVCLHALLSPLLHALLRMRIRGLLAFAPFVSTACLSCATFLLGLERYSE